jgi:hypothetical protein
MVVAGVANMPSTIKAAIWLVVLTTVIDIGLAAYTSIKLEPMYQQLFQNLNDSVRQIPAVFIAYFIFGFALANILTMFFLAIIICKGLKTGKKGIYILSLLYAVLGLFTVAFSLFGSGFSRGLFGYLLVYVKPEVGERLLQSVASAAISTTTVDSIQFCLLMVLLVLLMDKKSRAWIARASVKQ